MGKILSKKFIIKSATHLRELNCAISFLPSVTRGSAAAAGEIPQPGLRSSLVCCTSKRRRQASQRSSPCVERQNLCYSFLSYHVLLTFPETNDKLYPSLVTETCAMWCGEYILVPKKHCRCLVPQACCRKAHVLTDMECTSLVNQGMNIPDPDFVHRY